MADDDGGLRSAGRGVGSMSDAAIVRLVATGRGVDDAMAELWRRFGGLAYVVALGLLHDPALAQDAVQEAFVSLWRSAPRYDARRGTVRSWLSELVRRRAVDLLKPVSVGRELPTCWLAEGAGASTDELAATRAEQREVRAAVGRLEPSQRQVLELAYFAGLTQREISARLGVPLGTVKGRTTAAMTQLRTTLDDRWGFGDTYRRRPDDSAHHAAGRAAVERSSRIPANVELFVR